MNLPSCVCAAVLTTLFCGCSNRSNGGSTFSPTSPVVMELEVMGDKLQSTQPAQLRATFGSPSLVDFWFGTANGTQTVSLNGQIPSSVLGSAAFDLGISSGPMSEGMASLDLKNVATTDLSGGRVHVDVTANSIRGKVTLPSTSQEWPFLGKLSVSCWVPGSSISGSAPATGGGTSDPGALVLDVAFASAECAPLRVWAGK
jgi:hypothetical protein